MRDFLLNILIGFGREPVLTDEIVKSDFIGYDKYMFDAVHLGYMTRQRRFQARDYYYCLTDKAINFIQGE